MAKKLEIRRSQNPAAPAPLKEKNSDLMPVGVAHFVTLSGKVIGPNDDGLPPSAYGDYRVPNSNK